MSNKNGIIWDANIISYEEYILVVFFLTFSITKLQLKEI